MARFLDQCTTTEVRAVLVAEKLKTLVGGLQFVSKAGKEISIECYTDTLVLRALNDSHSASAEITFTRLFFTEYTLPPDLRRCELSTMDPSLPLVKCTTLASTLLGIFKSTKNVISVDIALELEGHPSNDDHFDANVIVFQLHCDRMITKTHRIRLTESQTMRPVFNKASSPSRIKLRPFHLATLLQHIYGTDEVCMSCSPTQVKFESYFTNPLDVKNHVHTETAVDNSEFISCTIQDFVDHNNGCDSEVIQLIFCLKEIKALLAFCVASALPELNLYFSRGGRYRTCATID
ncbi:hypothetical protein, variant 1 [Aphanomyces invadans]|uniref:Uncharacterized protein n=1 Tax=Aphanomyces invadans TaxID=157072 RepID=A0A024UU08_9STRA|nr:hypothetical protein, variant 1 [Aphanomyces invadans]ETW10006.1 hypothetical protein, variant 1 [Aphanomyces invadans]|eukprot:XP_008861417.1 hypothetical protein, variant 1 [Aphanomyces invadans]